MTLAAVMPLAELLETDAISWLGVTTRVTAAVGRIPKGAELLLAGWVHVAHLVALNIESKAAGGPECALVADDRVAILHAPLR